MPETTRDELCRLVSGARNRGFTSAISQTRLTREPIAQRPVRLVTYDLVAVS